MTFNKVDYLCILIADREEHDIAFASYDVHFALGVFLKSFD